MSDAFDVCVIGSGAGGGPVAATVAEAGHTVVVLEKGPRFDQRQFLKDEIVQCRRNTFWPDARDEPHVREWWDGSAWKTKRTRDFWNGSLVGGASVLMSGFFLRMKPDDFRLRSTYGPIEGADVADWPIGYDDLEPYYDRAEEEVGVSGAVVPLPARLRDRRSREDFPLPPTEVHPFAARIDETCTRMGLHPIPVPRAILPYYWEGRKGCEYAGYCGSYGCSSGAKGSSLAAFIPRAEKTKRCEVRSRANVTRLVSDETGRVVRAEYRDAEGRIRSVEASIFVVACQAVESARLLLASPGPRHPKGLANGSGLVGRNFLSSTFASGLADFPYAAYPGESWLRSKEPFVNRVVQDWNFIDDPELGRRKGGTLNFLRLHPNPIDRAMSLATWDQVPGDAPVWGAALKEKLRHQFQDVEPLKVEVFGEWLPNPWCRVSLDPSVRDAWGSPVARINASTHVQSQETAEFLLRKGLGILEALGGQNIRPFPRTGAPSSNLVGGTCRFGKDPARSVLDPECRAHEVENLFVTDGSFMPTAGSVPFTFTIYANALRVADKIVGQLGGVAPAPGK